MHSTQVTLFYTLGGGPDLTGYYSSAIIKYMKIAARKLFNIAKEIISISNQPVKHVTMDASNTTQSNIQYTAIKITNTIQFCFLKFHIKYYVMYN